MSSKEQKQQLLAQKLFRNLKCKKHGSNDHKDKEEETSKKSKSQTKDTKSSKKESESVLTQRAVEEIQREMQRRSRLAEEIGPSAWRVNTTKTTNKRFLANTMRSVLSHNERTSAKHATKSQQKYNELERRPPKFGKRLHSSQLSDERLPKQSKNDSVS